MKLTKSKLKQTIKEELEIVLNEGDWADWLPDWYQNMYGPEEQTIHHGVEWFEQQPKTSQHAIHSRYRTTLPSEQSDINTKDWNEWLWRYEVPTNVKQGRD